ncbi:patatin-like phospholipase family protein [Variovorax sp. RCC_210]|uniref:patatin-like phospholipase family protein n=1 Tax=Variovorax sp. RCC_210 TaxID=3239217 RepID=UPI003525E958
MLISTVSEAEEQPLGGTPSEPPEAAKLLKFADVLASELAAIKVARDRLEGKLSLSAKPSSDPPRTNPNGSAPSQASESRTGLALSGGGIRSATFCLGVLQALAKKDQLHHVDYLSTVSGGGYIGAWLSAWIYRKGLPEVCKALAARDGPKEADEVTWLRRYSNYLTPSLGMLSADSMTVVATWLRNVALNLIIFVSFLCLFFLGPRLLLHPTMYAVAYLDKELGYAASWMGFFLFPLAIAFHLSRTMALDTGQRIALMNSTWGVLGIVVIPGLITALLGSIALFGKATGFTGDLSAIAIIATTLLASGGGFWAILQVLGGRTLPSLIREAGVYVLAYAGALLVGGLLLRAFIELITVTSDNTVERAAALLTFGPPALLLTFGIVGSVLVGLIGRTYTERTREWWSRMNAWFAILGVSWLGLFLLSFYSAAIYRWVDDRSGQWFAAIAGTGWLVSLVATLFTPARKKQDEVRSPLLDTARSAVLSTALVLVVVGMLWGVAATTGVAMEYIGGCVGKQECARRPDIWNHRPTSQQVELFVKAEPGKAAVVTMAPLVPEHKSLRQFATESFALQKYAAQVCVAPNGFDSPHITVTNPPLSCDGVLNMGVSGIAFMFCFVIFVLFGSRVDVNKFSLHNMYKTRLIRCYLGASRQARRTAHPFTGFDDKDDVYLCNMRHTKMDSSIPVRPHHILNAAINITQGSNLAWQERKAASFTFTPNQCGFALGPSTGDSMGATAMSAGVMRVGGYRPTTEWASEQDEGKTFTLGMAMATSGAALSPNRGAATTPALAFLLTVFNARLGRWSPNPLWRLGWRRSSPVFGLFCLLHELFGYTNETSNFVYLSDGGHFDNSGVYELVRRRCTMILAVDATADSARGMEDLANLVRKCRIDFGVEIDFNLDRLGTSEERQDRSDGFVRGTINYGTVMGTIVIIKPTLVAIRKLGVDVFAYSRKNTLFPHETTVDQFFSESQFESYRKLGEQLGEACLAKNAFATAGNRP